MATTKELMARASRGEASLGFDPLGGDVGRFEPKVPIEEIVRDPHQPRQDLGGEDFAELANSIRAHGVLQPVVLTELDEDRYMILAGERRVAASLKAGKKTVPAFIRSVKEQDRLELQLVENLHRRDLTPLEESAGYQALKTQHSLKDEDIAQRVGKSRSRITEMLSLNRIPEQVREQCRNSDMLPSLQTLILMAKQKTASDMLRVLTDVRNDKPFRERYELARTGKPRTQSEKKPKVRFDTGQNTTVIIQALDSDELTQERQITALKDALKIARGNG